MSLAPLRVGRAVIREGRPAFAVSAGVSAGEVFATLAEAEGRARILTLEQRAGLSRSRGMVQVWVSWPNGA